MTGLPCTWWHSGEHDSLYNNASVLALCQSNSECLSITSIPIICTADHVENIVEIWYLKIHKDVKMTSEIFEMRLKKNWNYVDETLKLHTNEYALRRFHGNIATEKSPKPGLCPTLISNDFKGIVYNTIGSTIHSIPLHSLQHCIWTTSMTNIWPYQDSNLVPPG